MTSNTAVAIASAVAMGTTTAERVTFDALERAEAVEQLNVFTRLDADSALIRARGLDEEMAAGRPPGRLAGVPIILKDIVDQAGIPTTAGSSFLTAAAAADAPVVERLEAEGAIVIGRSGLHEFAYGFSSENDWWGAVRNPWDPSTSPGGSSGGSAAGVAAGVAPVGIGTDTGGSVRVPAALCGLVGLKVTHGRVPLTGVFPLAPSLDTVGPITTTVADAVLAYESIAGHDPDDRWSRDHPVERPSAPAIEDLVVGIPHPWIDRPLAPEQASGFALVRRVLEAGGATVLDLELPELDTADLPRFPGAYHEVAEVHRTWFERDPDRYGPAIRDRLAPVLELDHDDVEAARGWRVRIGAAFEDAFGRCNLLMTPATAARAKTIGADLVDVGTGPEPYRPALSWFTTLVNQAGLPAIALPVEDPGVLGLPPSVQLIGPEWGESLILGAAARLAEAGIVAQRTPPYVTREHGQAYNAATHPQGGRDARPRRANPSATSPVKE